MRNLLEIEICGRKNPGNRAGTDGHAEHDYHTVDCGLQAMQELTHVRFDAARTRAAQNGE
jgi:hypothetical protein